jgi:hypothetical protein
VFDPHHPLYRGLRQTTMDAGLVFDAWVSYGRCDLVHENRPLLKLDSQKLLNHPGPGFRANPPTNACDLMRKPRRSYQVYFPAPRGSMRPGMMHSSQQFSVKVFPEKILQSASHGPDLNARNAILRFDRRTARNSMCSVPWLRAASSNNRSMCSIRLSDWTSERSHCSSGSATSPLPKKGALVGLNSLRPCFIRYVARALRSSRFVACDNRIIHLEVRADVSFE